MAYNDSGEIPASQSTYSLGGYTFELKVQNVHEPGEEEVVSVFAICRGPDGSRETQARDFPAEATVESWSVEANETEATVYAHVVVEPPDYGIVEPFIPSDLIPGSKYGNIQLRILSGSSELIKTVYVEPGTCINASLSPVIARMYDTSSRGWGMYYNAQTAFTYKGKTVYYGSSFTSFDYWNSFGSGQASAQQTLSAPMIAWVMFYGQGERTETDEMIGRFAIDLHEAAPEDWDEPPSTGDPSYTLNVYVTGASAGTHDSENIPLDGEIQAVYGSGGNGGNGGGGGAGASTVIIYEFATDKAGSVNQEAYAREAGAGGPGGPGGRGADGCIIIFY